MHRFYLPPEQCQGTELVLAESEAHHAADVLRLRAGERVTVLDGAGREFLCQVRESHRRRVGLTVEKTNSIPAPSCRITLLQAVPKGKIIESIIQKATELGAARVVPLLSERVTLQFEAKADAESKARKWQAVAVEAIKQCGQPWLPVVETPLTPAEFLARGEKFDLTLVGSLQNDARHPREYFQHRRPPVSLAVWIGPEGDFTPAELDAIQASGARPITFGPLVLRSETAAIYALSVLNYELQSPA